MLRLVICKPAIAFYFITLRSRMYFCFSRMKHITFVFLSNLCTNVLYLLKSFISCMITFFIFLRLLAHARVVSVKSKEAAQHKLLSIWGPKMWAAGFETAMSQFFLKLICSMYRGSFDCRRSGRISQLKTASQS